MKKGVLYLVNCLSTFLTGRVNHPSFCNYYYHFQNDPVPGTSNESKRQKRDEARERMVDALPENDDEYLDISLDDEKKLIEKYKKFLGL